MVGPSPLLVRRVCPLGRVKTVKELWQSRKITAIYRDGSRSRPECPVVRESPMRRLAPSFMQETVVTAMGKPIADSDQKKIS